MEETDAAAPLGKTNRVEVPTPSLLSILSAQP
jgi:hypothetical protein